MFYKYEEWINIFLWALFVIGILSVLLITVKSDTSSEVISTTEQLEVVNKLNPIGDDSSGLYYDSDTEVVYTIDSDYESPIVYYAYNGNVMHYCPHEDSYYTVTPEGDKVSTDLFAHST